MIPRFLRYIFGDVIIKQTMPPLLTVEQILRKLNAEKIGETWYVVDNFYTLPATTVTGSQSIILSLTAGVVTKIFVNQQTAEVRTFLAKRTNVPGHENL